MPNQRARLMAGGNQSSRPRGGAAAWPGGGRCAGDCLTRAAECPLFSENWDGELRRNEPLAPLTTLRVGGPAAVAARPSTLAQLASLLALLDWLGCPRRVLGRGSNLLVADEGYAGVAIILGQRLGRITRVPAAPEPAGREAADRVLVRVEAGCSLAALLAWALKRGLGGLEFLAGIPGSIGGAVMMNAGAWGESLGERVHALEVVSGGRVRVINRSALEFSYRLVQGLAADEVVGAAILALVAREPATIQALVRQRHEQRRAAQPRGVASAGSFFKNPPGDYAGRLIEQAGLKGVRVGGAQVSRKHANFLINSQGARAADLLALMKLVQEQVLARFGVRLEPEVHLLGFERE
jgi:UDP-N-acetylmuramate dehydrogenase